MKTQSELIKAIKDKNELLLKNGFILRTTFDDKVIVIISYNTEGGESNDIWYAINGSLIWKTLEKFGFKNEDAFQIVKEFTENGEKWESDDMFFVVFDYGHPDKIFLFNQNNLVVSSQTASDGAKINTMENKHWLVEDEDNKRRIVISSDRPKIGEILPKVEWEGGHEKVKVTKVIGITENMKQGAKINSMEKNIYELLDLENIEQYYDYIHESYINGQFSQVRKLVNNMDDDQKKGFFSYAREMGYNKTINWINEKMEKGGKISTKSFFDKFFNH